MGVTLGVAGLGAVAVVSCSQGVRQNQAATATGQYEILFPSTLTALDTDTVEVFVFDADAPGADCLSLVATRQAKAGLPEEPALLQDTGPIGVCALESTPLTVSFGHRSLLAVGQRAGTDLLTGCVEGDVALDSSILSIYLAQANIDLALPDASCTSLAQRCDGGC
jgi:hypothetical protein